jgi:hypothetical protein
MNTLGTNIPFYIPFYYMFGYLWKILYRVNALKTIKTQEN